MALPLLAGASQLFFPLAYFWNGVVSKINGERSRALNLELAEKQYQHQRELEESRQQAELKLACLNIEYQTALEQDRQAFQVNLETSRQAFQERMEELRFGHRVELEKAKQIFQEKLTKLNHQHQRELEEFRQSVKWAINKKNLEFQQWRFEQERTLQQQLAAYNRQTQFEIAAYQRQTAIQLAQVQAEIHKIFDNWPLRLSPAQILGSHAKDECIPLRIIIAPPDVDFDRFDTAQGASKFEKRLAEGLGQFLSQNYSLNRQDRPTKFLDGAWESKRFNGGASIEALFGMLKPVPTLILESEIDGAYLNFRIAYWGLGQEEYYYERIISRLPYWEIIYESAKARALEWKKTREQLLADGVEQTLEEIDRMYGGNNPENLGILEREERLRLSGVERSKLPPVRYKYDDKDFEALYQFLITCHCLIAGWFADVHHLTHYDVSPLLPELLPNLTQNVFTQRLVQEILSGIVSGYRDIYKALESERPHWVPEMTLQLAQSLAQLSDKSFAEEMVAYSIQCWLQLRGLPPESDSLSKLSNRNDIPFLAELAKIYQLIGANDKAVRVNDLIQTLTTEFEPIQGFIY